MSNNHQKQLQETPNKSIHFKSTYWTYQSGIGSNRFTQKENNNCYICFAAREENKLPSSYECD